MGPALQAPLLKQPSISQPLSVGLGVNDRQGLRIRIHAEILNASAKGVITLHGHESDQEQQGDGGGRELSEPTPCVPT